VLQAEASSLRSAEVSPDPPGNQDHRGNADQKNQSGGTMSLSIVFVPLLA